MYDVALSFAGEDRSTAAAIADLATAAGLSVFYDDYERAALWGKDLAAHLDTVYRKNALYCIVLVSEAYNQKLWTRHEIRSVFARAMEDSDVEYLLPVRLDDADLAGLPPTVGYIDARITEPDEIVRLLCQKLDVSSDETFKVNANLERLRQLSIPCSTFIVDRRYIYSDGVESRLAVSFGPNGPHAYGHVLMPNEQEGPYVLGMHCVGQLPGEKNVLRLLDKWYDSRSYVSDMSQVAALKAATAWLDEISDETYAFDAGDGYPSSANDVHYSRPIKLSEVMIKGDTDL